MVTELDKKVQHPRDKTQVVDEYIGPESQLVIDTERKEIRLQDGRTPGGWRIPNLSQLRRLFVSSDSDAGKLKFATDLVGIVARTADKTFRLRSLKAGDGISITNANGQAGDITIGVTARLAGKIPAVTSDYDSAVDTGNYIMSKTAANKPAGLGANHGALSVIAGYDESENLMILQTVVSISDNTNTAYVRRFLSGVWTSWA